MASNRSLSRRLLSHVMALAIAAGPFAVSLHAAHHVVHSSAASYSAHDEHAHHAHSSPDQHHLCGLCVHAKAPFVTAPPAPQALASATPDSAPALAEQRLLPPARTAAASPRAPPSIS